MVWYGPGLQNPQQDQSAEGASRDFKFVVSLAGQGYYVRSKYPESEFRFVPVPAEEASGLRSNLP
jgi:hypothetical protein